VNNESSDLQKLLRLKSYEQPEDGYFDDFLGEFQNRQRSELLKRSSISLFRERLIVWMKELNFGKLATGGALVYALVMFAIMAWPSSTVEEVPIQVIPVSGYEPLELKISRVNRIEFTKPYHSIPVTTQEF